MDSIWPMQEKADTRLEIKPLGRFSAYVSLSPRFLRGHIANCGKKRANPIRTAPSRMLIYGSHLRVPHQLMANFATSEPSFGR